MSYYDEYAQNVPLQGVRQGARAEFITKTYSHLAGATGLFVAIEVVIFKSGIAERMAAALAQSWLFVLGAFMIVSWMASGLAHRAKSKVAQYAALGGYVLAEAIIFVPLLWVANEFAPGAISSAAAISLFGFAALTVIAFMTRKDFSFLRGFLMWAGFGALALIVGGLVFGFGLGLYFSVGMIIFAGAAILYNTSNVIHHYDEESYVAAALELFAAFALLLWYVLRIVISFSSSD